MRARCHICGKVCHSSRKAARRAARKLHGKHASTYRCGPYWHVGTMPDRVIRGDLDRADIRNRTITVDEVAERRRSDTGRRRKW